MKFDLKLTFSRGTVNSYAMNNENSFFLNTLRFIEFGESYFFIDIVSLIIGIEFKWRATRIKYNVAGEIEIAVF